MNKSDIVRAIVEKSENEKITKTIVQEILSLQEDVFVDILKKGDKIQMLGIISIEPKARSPRKGFNPLNNEEFNIEAKMGIKVQAGKRLKEAVESLDLATFLKK